MSFSPWIRAMREDRVSASDRKLAWSCRDPSSDGAASKLTRGSIATREPIVAFRPRRNILDRRRLRGPPGRLPKGPFHPWNGGRAAIPFAVRGGGVKKKGARGVDLEGPHST